MLKFWGYMAPGPPAGYAYAY